MNDEIDKVFRSLSKDELIQGLIDCGLGDSRYEVPTHVRLASENELLQQKIHEYLKEYGLDCHLKMSHNDNYLATFTAPFPFGTLVFKYYKRIKQGELYVQDPQKAILGAID